MLTDSQNGKIRYDIKPGLRFGKWVLIEKSTDLKDSWDKLKWWAQCDCGTIRAISMRMARKGMTKSCGCVAQSKKGTSMKKTKAFSVLKGMVKRCYQPSHMKYKYYGAKGVFVCDRWRGVGGVKRFIEDMGHPPKGKQIDRINPFDGYHPENCRWVTPAENNRNQRKHFLKKIELSDEEKDLLG